MTAALQQATRSESWCQVTPCHSPAKHILLVSLEKMWGASQLIGDPLCSSQNWGSVSSGGKDDGLRSRGFLTPWLWPTLTLCLFSLVSVPPALSSSIWLLLKNPVFILLCLAGATEATLIAGMSTFGPKFLESQFSLSASEAATLFGEKSL